MKKLVTKYDVMLDDDRLPGLTRYFEVEAEVSYHTDEFYGQDADGNRGMPKTFIDNVQILSIKEYNENNEVICNDFESLSLPVQSAITEGANL